MSTIFDILHLVRRFPPTVMMLSRIEHPCVQNGRIGLDFLKVAYNKTKKKQTAPKTTQRYKMWSPAYTAKSILIQLQGAGYLGYLDHNRCYTY
jgi:ubiquitin-protein ligase